MCDPHKMTVECAELRRDYAVLRYTLDQIRRKVGSENFLNDEGVDPVDIQDMARDALSITMPAPTCFVTNASIRRYIHEKLEQKKEASNGTVLQNRD